jgi:hypothetical protein
MSAFILDRNAVVLCSHAGRATPQAPSRRVMLSNQPLITIASPYAVSACSLSGTSSPPCVTGQLMAGATRVVSDGAPVATLTSQTTCVPTGTPLLPLVSQMRVLAS